MSKTVCNRMLVLLIAVLLISALMLPAFATEADLAGDATDSDLLIATNDVDASAETVASQGASPVLKVLKIVAIVLDVVAAVVLIVVVLLQSGKSAGLSGAIAGNSGSFVSKTGAKTLDAKLARSTKWIGLAFVALTLITVILVRMVEKA